ncbi:MAG: C25 family cysteine peptidase, partial [Ignavibacteriaceae bacterium]
PAVNEAIIAAMNNGSLIVHYVGHGNEHVWAHESVFENSSSIPRLHNPRYFFLTIAACAFGYYDKTTVQSGAELLLLKANSGAIGAFTSTRPVFANDNAAITDTFYTKLFREKKSITVGNAYFLTKIKRYAGYEDNDQRFTLLGDPATRLLVPQYSASIDSINGHKFNSSDISASTIQLKALSQTRIEGVIEKPDNTVWSDFNGEGIISVYDSERKVLLPQLAGPGYPDGYPMTVQGGTIFRGRVSVTNGHFSSNFIVPKDISYQNENGKVIIYFYNNAGDGLGYTDNIIIGGTDSSVVNDGKGPDVEIYFDSATPSTSFLINPNSKLIVKLSDETGINSTGTGVGHQLEGILNDNISSPIDFTNDFTGDKDSGGKSGEINYSFNDITPGEYKIEVKAWDVFNNYSSKTAYFTVVSGDDLVLSNVYNYPNPFSGNTTFTFQQNLNSVIDLKIKIYTIAGRLIKEIDKSSISDKYVMVPWDGRDADGDVIANGTYFYKLIVKTSDGKYNTSIIGKLAVIR